MINGLGVLGWGVGGIEAEAAMLGQPVSMLVPQVVGFKLTGKLPRGRDGDGPRAHRDADAPQDRRRREVRRVLRARPRDAAARRPRDDREHGARVRRDVRLLPGRRRDARYLRLTGRPRSGSRSSRRTARSRASGATRTTPSRSTPQIVELDLCDGRALLAGPRRPQDRVPLADAKRRSSRRCRASASTTNAARRSSRRDFPASDPSAAASPGTSPSGGAIAAISPSLEPRAIGDAVDGDDLRADHGSVVIAAITSLHEHVEPGGHARRGPAREERGRARPHAQAVGEVEPRARLEGRRPSTSRRRGSRRTSRSSASTLVGYGCTTCIGNSGPLPEPIAQAIDEATSRRAPCSRATATSRGGSTRR